MQARKCHDHFYQNGLNYCPTEGTMQDYKGQLYLTNPSTVYRDGMIILLSVDLLPNYVIIGGGGVKSETKLSSIMHR